MTDDRTGTGPGRPPEGAADDDVVAHLRAALRELIAAARGVLDLVEKVVEDPLAPVRAGGRGEARPRAEVERITVIEGGEAGGGSPGAGEGVRNG